MGGDSQVNILPRRYETFVATAKNCAQADIIIWIKKSGSIITIAFRISIVSFFRA